MTIPTTTGQVYPPLGGSASLGDGDKGDITVSSSGTVWTIDNDAVTYAKLQNVSATSRVLGRKTAGAGDTEELTMSEVLDFVGSAAQGDILYRNASAWVRLGAGTSGQFLKTNGGSANPSWATPSSVAGAADPYEYTDRSFEHFADADAVAYVLSKVDTTLSSAGSSTGETDTDGRWLRNATTAVSGNATYVQGITSNILRRRWGVIMTHRCKTYSTITSMRVWIGLHSSAPEATDTPGGHLASFRYSTGAGDTNWMACVNDNTSFTANSTGVAVATDTMYLLRVETDSSECRFYINGSLVYTHSANLPGIDTSMGWNWSATTLTAASREFRYGRTFVRQRG